MTDVPRSIGSRLHLVLQHSSDLKESGQLADAALKS